MTQEGKIFPGRLVKLTWYLKNNLGLTHSYICILGSIFNVSNKLSYNLSSDNLIASPNPSHSISDNPLQVSKLVISNDHKKLVIKAQQ